MKKNFTKQALFLCQFALFALFANAQYTETFETQTPSASSFTSNGQSFTLTNSFQIFSSRAGYGYQHSNRFVDNSSIVNTNQTNSIKTSDGTKFTLENLWLYVSSDGGNNPSADGSVIIIGKLNGVVQFTINKASGFSTAFGPNNGWSYIDFTNEGGVNNSKVNIDEIQFQLQGNFNYIGIDNFTWAPQSIVLPVSLLSYSASIQQGGSVKLSWRTAYENNLNNYIIEKSTDGMNFKAVGTVVASNNGSITTSYDFVDLTPVQGINYYRLEEVDKDGFVKQLGVKSITLYSGFSQSSLYPNPVTNGSFTLTSESPASTPNSYLLTDMSGRILQRGIISSAQQQVNVSKLVPGNYTIKLSDGEVIKWIKK